MKPRCNHRKPKENNNESENMRPSSLRRRNDLLIKLAEDEKITLFGVSFLTLGYLGTVGVTEIRKIMSIICTIIYFAYFLLMPIYTKYEKTKEVPTRL